MCDSKCFQKLISGMIAPRIPKVWGPNRTPLHDESISYMKIVASLGWKPFEAISIAEGQRQLDTLAAACIKDRHYDGTVEDKKIPSPNKKDGIRIRIYRPSNLPADPTIIVFFHGGGHVFGNLEQYERMNKALSTFCGCIMAAVENRMCPNHTILDGMDDSVVATQWVLEHRTSVGGSARSLVGTAGESSGAQYAIHATHQLKAALDFQIPIYPWIDMTGRPGFSPSRTEFAHGPMVTQANYEWLSDIVVQGRDKEDPRWSPVYHKDVDGVPPALFILTELDPVRDDGRRYAKMLIDGGIATEVLELKGSMHTFFMLPDHFERLTRQAYSKVAAFLDWLKIADSCK